MKLQKGSILPDFTFQTAFGGEKALYETIGEKPTFLLFLRYYGCTICQLDIHRLAEEYDIFTRKGAQVLVVLQSKPEVIQKDAGAEKLPFTILCDPEEKLYKEYEILPAKSKLGLVSLGTIKKLGAAKKEFQHGEYEGNELQLPALFLVGPGGRVDYAHYAKNLADLPTHDMMLALLK